MVRQRHASEFTDELPGRFGELATRMESYLKQGMWVARDGASRIALYDRENLICGPSADAVRQRCIELNIDLGSVDFTPVMGRV